MFDDLGQILEISRVEYALKLFTLYAPKLMNFLFIRYNILKRSFAACLFFFFLIEITLIRYCG